MTEPLLLVAAVSAVLSVALCAGLYGAVLWVVLRGRGGEDVQRLRLLAEQALAAARAEGETTRAHMAATERALAERAERSRLEMQEALGTLQTGLAREAGEARALMEAKLREMSELSAARLAEIQNAVEARLQGAVEKQMQASFQRVIDQFAQVQRAVGDVQAVAAQIGDIKRIFGNVKSRGGWGETQLRALLDDHLPHGGYETNRKLRPDGDEMVEFAVVMPVKGDTRPVLAIDSKFPLEDYERLIQASEAGDTEGERLARRGLEQRLRAEARKIASKYIHPPVTVEFAVLYLPTDGLYVEVARMPGLIEELGRVHRVLVVGPSLCPALLRTIQLGFMTLALEQKAGQIHELLGATRGEMARMDEVLSKLSKQAGVLGSTIEAARTRTRVVQRKLRTVDALDAAQADALLDLGDVAEAAE